jgi:two-component system, NarL family, response regulator LiaR
MIRVLICDDQIIVCEGLEAILSAEPGIEVVGMAQDGAEALELIDKLQPAVVLMDLKMPGLDGIQATNRITSRHPNTRVLVLTTFGDDEWIFDAIRSGAAGFLLKGTPKATLIAAVKGTAEGQTYIDPTIAGRLFAHIAQRSPQPDTSVVSELSEREIEVLQLLAQGLTNREIAGRLHLSNGTVRNYVSSIFSKLNVDDRTQAAVFALRHGLVDLDNL